MVQHSVVGSWCEVNNKLGYRSIHDKQTVEGEKEALDGVELGYVRLWLQLHCICLGFFLLRLGNESPLGVSWLRWSSGHLGGHQRQPIAK